MIEFVRDNLAGAWALMNGRADGLRRLDLSVEGFWRSFAAILLVLPLSLLTTLAVGRAAATGEDAVHLGGSAGGEILAALVDWVAFPLLFAALAGPLGLASRFVPYIVARNWASVIVAALYALAVAPHFLGLLSPEALGFVLLIVFGVALRFAYLVARTALLVQPLVAAPLVAVEVLVSLLIGFVADRWV